jgi:hypothetical protein
MDKQQTLFAFQLASNQRAEQSQDTTNEPLKWQPRDGIAVAGCTGPDARASSRIFGYDNGIYC